MVKEMRFFVKSSFFRRVTTKAKLKTKPCFSFINTFSFTENYEIFQYFEILSKSDLLEMKKKSMHTVIKINVKKLNQGNMLGNLCIFSE